MRAYASRAPNRRSLAEQSETGFWRDRSGHFHCGVSPVEVAAALARTRSLIESACTLTGNGHSLQPVDDSGPPADGRRKR